MKNKMAFIITIIAFIGIISLSCDNGNEACTHTAGAAATCMTAQKCTKCNEIIQAPLGHGNISGTWSTTGKVVKNCDRIGCTGYSINEEMVQIPAGTYTMGPDIWNNNATVEMTLSAFKMSKYLVTQELYQAVTGNNPSSFSSSPDGTEVQGKRPVETITWFDAVEFCNKLSEREGLTPVYTITGRTPETGYPITAATVIPNWSNNGYRLPTDTQWEYACRAGTNTDWYFGNDVNELKNYAWYSANSNNKTHEVGLKTKNAFGLYDMHGNVWEWCWDWFADYPVEPKTDYFGPSAGTDRVERGGSWYSSAEITRSARRGYGYPYYGYFNLGFRLVRP